MEILVDQHLRKAALALIGVMSAVGSAWAGKPAPDFRFEIRPILSKNCFSCHGPDDGHRQADLRLDVHDAAVDHGAIVPGARLVSPKAGDKGVVTHARAQPIRDSDQQPVPDRVAKHIVHGLETIQVKVDNGKLFAPARSLERLLGLTPTEPTALYRAVGCEHCSGLGYRGRVGIFELMVTGDTIREMCVQRLNAAAIRNQALKEGMITLRQDGWRKVLQGITTVDEVARVTAGDIS